MPVPPAPPPTLLVFTLGERAEARRRRLLPRQEVRTEEELHRACLDAALAAGRESGCRVIAATPAPVALPADVGTLIQRGRTFGARLAAAVSDAGDGSVTVEAFRGKEGPCVERRQAVVYRGPFREVLDDDGHRIRRGVRTAVCDKTFQLLARSPYREHFDFVEPLAPVPLDEAAPFDCARTLPRHPRESKGLDYDLTTEAAACCAPGEDCC